MTLQEFINSTLSQGNPRIPANRNQIMQQTSIVHYNDLSGNYMHTCPISLTTFDASSNILRINECNHIFQSDSLMRWFQEDSRCPICRYNINRDLSNQPISTNQGVGVNRNNHENENYQDEELPTNTLVYDISFSIPQLFGRDMSENQINSVIESITNTITNTMNNSLSNYNNSMNTDGDVVVQEIVVEQVDNNNRNSSFQSMEDDSDEN